MTAFEGHVQDEMPDSEKPNVPKYPKFCPIARLFTICHSEICYGVLMYIYQVLNMRLVHLAMPQQLVQLDLELSQSKGGSNYKRMLNKKRRACGTHFQLVIEFLNANVKGRINRLS